MSSNFCRQKSLIETGRGRDSRPAPVWPDIALPRGPRIVWTFPYFFLGTVVVVVDFATTGRLDATVTFQLQVVFIAKL